MQLVHRPEIPATMAETEKMQRCMGQNKYSSWDRTASKKNFPCQIGKEMRIFVQNGKFLKREKPGLH